jgi:hypothetical protein
MAKRYARTRKHRRNTKRSSGSKKHRYGKKTMRRRIARGSNNRTEYIVTVHNADGTQITDMDLSIDDPNEFIEEFERSSRIGAITPMPDRLIPTYTRTMGVSTSDISDDELASLWFITTDGTRNLQNEYNFTYNGNNYIIRLHRI